MRLKNILLMISVLVFMHSISAAIVYCPTTVVCDKSDTCKVNEDNGYSNFTVTKNNVFPGAYFLEVVQSNPKTSPYNSACWYGNAKHPVSWVIVASNNSYYPSGPNWVDFNLGFVCPSTNWGFNEFVIPQACALSTTPAIKK